MSSPLLNLIVGYLCLIAAYFQLKDGRRGLYYFTLCWAVGNFICATALLAVKR